MTGKGPRRGGRITRAIRRRTKASGAAAGRSGAAFIPYLTCGDPDLATSARLLDALAEAGADVIELGVPFSDPVADGPTIQRASERALASGASLAAVLDLAREFRRRHGTALVLFTYFNPVHRYGVRALARDAAAAGVDGVLVPDLSLEESRPVREALAVEKIDLVLLAAPNTPGARLAKLARATRGFLYCVSLLGVTGARDALPPDLAEFLGRAREAARVPVALGFGVSTPAHASAVAELADGVVVGSALVREVEAAESADEAIERVRRLASALGRAAHGEGNTPA